MKIINLGILAHVDAGKTTLTESLLYTSGAIAELGSVDKGTTRTDTMNLERQRGITIQTAVASFQWEDVKVNIIDTPGHMDFLAEVYRSLSVLDGAVLLVSAKDGIQAQTRILFHALQTMKIPTIFFINKIDQEGIDLPMVYREMKAKLSSEIIVKQKVGQHPHINVTDNDDMGQWDAVIMGNDGLLEKYMSGKPFKMSELEQEENRRFQNGTLFPVYHGTQNHHRPVNHTSLSTYFKPFSRNINTLAIIPKSFPSINPPICYALYHAFYCVPVFSMRPALLFSKPLSFRKTHLLLVLFSSVPCHCRPLSFLRLSRLSFRHNNPILQAAYIYLLYWLNPLILGSVGSYRPCAGCFLPCAVFPLSDVLPSLAPVPAAGCPLSAVFPAYGVLPVPSAPVCAFPLGGVARPVCAVLPAAGCPVGVARPAYGVFPAAGVLLLRLARITGGSLRLVAPNADGHSLRLLPVCSVHS